MAVIPWAVILSRGGQGNPHRLEIRITKRISHDRYAGNRAEAGHILFRRCEIAQENVATLPQP
jgi:hypothetical protein